MHTLLQDLRFGIRLLRKNLTTTLAAILSLSLGIGATTAIFSVIYGALIDPFPYKDTRHMWVVRILNAKGKGGRFMNSIPEYLAIAKLPEVQDALATGFEEMLLSTSAGPETIRGVGMSGNAFSFLGVSPLLGRTITPQDLRPGGEPEHVVVLSYAQWQRLFAGDRNVIGQTMRLNDEPYTVIGVMPPRFTWFGRESIWRPLSLDPRGNQMVIVRLRLREGVSQVTASNALHGLFMSLAKEVPKNFPREGFNTSLVPYMDTTVASGQLRTSLYILLGAVAFLLLIGCVNVANLQLARATARQREIAVRVSLGAGRLRLIRQLLTESVFLALAGGGLGIVLAYGVLKWIVALIPDYYLPNEAVISLNGWVLGFSLIVSTFTGILFGLAPALQASKAGLNETLKDAGKGTPAGSRGGRTRQLLVVTEVALAVMLLVGAGLTMRSFLALESVPLGFSSDNLLLMDLPIAAKRYPTIQQRNNLVSKIVARLKSLPGVQAVSAGSGGYRWGGPQSGFTILGKTPSPEKRVHIAFVSDGYLAAMKIPLLRGRMFTEQELTRADRVVAINQTAATELWPNEDPIGKRISLDLLKAPPPFLLVAGSDPVLTIVGVIGDIRNAGLHETIKPNLYSPYSLVAPPGRSVVIRANGDPRRLINAIRAEVRAVDKDQPVVRFATGEENLAFETAGPRFTTLLFVIFAIIGLTLSAIGIYSVLAYAVSQRTHEIGVRMALGAQSRDVLWLVLRSGLQLVAIGLTVGLVASAFLTRLIETQLFGVTGKDPVSFCGVALVLSVAAVIACYLPARRATHLPPAISLRHE